MQIKDIVDRHGRSADKLIGIMLECQEYSQLNYLNSADILCISKEMNIPESRVFSVASFYSLISTKPRGKYIIQLCNDVPCYIKGSMNLVQELEKLLNIKFGETTDDNLFTLEFTSCLGCCEMSPVMQIDDAVYGNLTPEKLTNILQEYRRKQDD